jgi:glycerate kinase
MSLRILIVPDKFKGTLTAQAAATLIAQGWKEVRPHDALELLPMSDGGDGFGEVLASLLRLEPQTCLTVDAAHRPRRATWWWDNEARTAVIESAEVIGLALLPRQQYHPFQLDTFGLGAVVRAAADAGATRCLLGIGGSATNDAGFGLACALDWTFLDSTGQAITRWTGLSKLSRMDQPADRIQVGETLVAVDVQNPLLGPVGASRVYGPQKGLQPHDFAAAESCLSRLAEIVERDLGWPAASEPGAGAAGGLGFGLRSFLGARLESGFELFARYARLEDRIHQSDLVITGEGAIDKSTLMGKGVGEIARLCLKNGVKCLGLAGFLGDSLASGASIEPFSEVYGMAPDLARVEEAQRQPEKWLSLLAARAAREECV